MRSETNAAVTAVVGTAMWGRPSGHSHVGTAASAVQPSAARCPSPDVSTSDLSSCGINRRSFDDGRNLKSVMSTITPARRAVLTILALAALSLAALQAHSSAADPKSIPMVDGGLGPCSAEFTITDPSGSAIYAATIQVHIAYGFMSLHKMDLQVGTNADGKARFDGLPDKLKQSLFFRAFEGNREGSAFDDPNKTCKASFTVALRQKPQEQ